MKTVYRCRMFLLLCLVVCAAAAGGCGKETVLYELQGERSGGDLSGTAEGPSGADAAETASGADAEADSETEPALPQEIWVYVCGAVERPGVYALPYGSRVYQALEAAGGMTEEAEERSLNQAAVLTDGEQITVFTGRELEEAGIRPGQEMPKAAEDPSSGKVDLNTAGKEELMTLPGIGEVRAAAIIAYRETNGPFTSPEEIMKVEGIKEKSFQKIKNQIEV